MKELFEKVTIIEGKPETLPKKKGNYITDIGILGYYKLNKKYFCRQDINPKREGNNKEPHYILIYPKWWLKPVEPVKISAEEFLKEKEQRERLLLGKRHVHRLTELLTQFLNANNNL